MPQLMKVRCPSCGHGFMVPLPAGAQTNGPEQICPRCGFASGAAADDREIEDEGGASASGAEGDGDGAGDGDGDGDGD